MAGLLLSVDLEDVRDGLSDGHRYEDRVVANTGRYLDRFRDWGVQATFFVVGKVARRHPELIMRILREGHEIGCHSDTHLQLDSHTPQSLEADLRANRGILESLGVSEIHGFRAPTFSLVASTSWAYRVLADTGFTYSSSVLPARNPLYGWPEFGQRCKKINGTVWEIPMTVAPLPGLRVPVAGGVYFRVLPFWFLQLVVRYCLRRQQVITTYFHPYDIDTQQERFMHPDLHENRFYNWLMYLNRDKLLDRLDRLRRSCPVSSYGRYAAALDSGGR